MSPEVIELKGASVQSDIWQVLACMVKRMNKKTHDGTGHWDVL